MEPDLNKTLKSLNDEHKKRIELIKCRIPDRGMRDFIFEYGEDNSAFLTDKKKYLDYFRNILYLVTIVAYKKFISFKTMLNCLQPNEKSKEIATFPNALVRIFNLLDDCYSSGRLEFSLIENVILNLQIDAAINRESKGFINRVGLQQFFNFSYIGNNLSKYIFSLKKSMLSSRYQPDYDFDDLIACIQSFPFLFNSEIKCEPFMDSDFIETVTINHGGDIINLEELLLVLEREQSYFLTGIVVNDPRITDANNLQKKQSIIAEYSTPSGRDEFKAVFSNHTIIERDETNLYFQGKTLVEDFLLKYRLVNVQSENDSSILWEYSFIDNKYIKYLAVNISDRINIEGKRLLNERYRGEYPEVFKRFNKDGIMHWDEILIFLLLEVGVYKLLFFLFKYTNLDYSEVKDAFRLRFGENVTKLEEQYEIIRDPLKGSIMRNDDGKIHANVQALIMLARKLLTANEIDVEVNDMMGSIAELSDNIKCVYGNDALGNDEKILYFANQIINLNNFIVIFYSGLLEYYAKIRIHDLENSARLFYKNSTVEPTENLSFETFRRSTLNARHRLYDKYNKLLKIKNLNTTAFNELIEMVNMSFNDVKALNADISSRNSDRNVCFYDMTGRRSLFNINDFEIVHKEILVAFERTKTDHLNITALFRAINRYIEYMMDGALDNDTTIEGAIYPIIGVCSSSVISQDGYRYSYLSVSNGREKARMEIKIITNEVLKTGEIYYCVPNVKRCFYTNLHRNENGIWMSPQIIPYMAYQPNAKASFEQLSSEADFEQTATLIYQSDQALYGKLFGCQDNAIKVLKYLFETRRSIFYKDYIRILRIPSEDSQKNLIIAVATFYPKMPEWDEDILSSAFEAANVELPKDYQTACMSIRDTFTESIGNNYYVSDICVHQAYRGKGYAKQLLNSLIRIAENGFMGKNIVLSVYDNNSAALGLYNIMGFIAYVAAYDSHGEGTEHQEKYYKMIKYI